MCWELALCLVQHFVHRLLGDLGCSGFHLMEECDQDEVVLSILLAWYPGLPLLVLSLACAVR